MSARVILLTGPSGSGKTSLLRRVGARRLRLDDFYRDGDEPGMPLLDCTRGGRRGVAAEIIEQCRELGLLADALVLRRPRWVTWWFRLRRDMAEHRKPLGVLLTRGLRLARQEPRMITRWTAQGARPVSARACAAAITEHVRPR